MNKNISSKYAFSSGFSENSSFNMYKIIAESSFNKFNSSILNKKRDYKINFEYKYLRDLSPNGKAYHIKNVDYIALNVGLIGNIHSLFYTLFSNPNVFSKIGNSDMEYRHSIVSFKFDDNIKEIGYTHFPNDAIRKEVSTTLSLFAIRFTIFHELAHHLSGHIFYIKEKTNKFELFTTNNDNNLEGLSALDYQTMEMDADSFAIINSIVNIYGIYVDFEKNSKLKKMIINRYELFTLWAFSIHCLFLIFEDNHKSVDIMKDKHLPAKYRQSLNLSAAMRFLNNMKLEDTDSLDKQDFLKKVNEYISFGIFQAEYCYNNSFNTNHNFVMDLFKNPNLLIHSQNVLDNWDNLRPKLERYARIELYHKSIDINKFTE